MKSKLPIIRAALEAGLTLEMRTPDKVDLLEALGIHVHDKSWLEVEKHLPCKAGYSNGFFYLQGIEKKEGAES